MKCRLGSLLIESLETYVRVTILDGFTGQPKSVKCTKRERPTAIEVAELVCEMRGLEIGWLDAATHRACGRAAADAAAA